MLIRMRINWLAVVYECGDVSTRLCICSVGGLFDRVRRYDAKCWGITFKYT